MRWSLRKWIRPRSKRNDTVGRSCGTGGSTRIRELHNVISINSLPRVFPFAMKANKAPAPRPAVKAISHPKPSPRRVRPSPARTSGSKPASSARKTATASESRRRRPRRNRVAAKPAAWQSPRQAKPAPKAKPAARRCPARRAGGGNGETGGAKSATPAAPATAGVKTGDRACRAKPAHGACDARSR